MQDLPLLNFWRTFTLTVTTSPRKKHCQFFLSSAILCYLHAVSGKHLTFRVNDLSILKYSFRMLRINKFYNNLLCVDVNIFFSGSLWQLSILSGFISTAQKMKFLVTLTEEMLNEKLYFLCSEHFGTPYHFLNSLILNFIWNTKYLNYFSCHKAQLLAVFNSRLVSLVCKFVLTVLTRNISLLSFLLAVQDIEIQS